MTRVSLARVLSAVSWSAGTQRLAHVLVLGLLFGTYALSLWGRQAIGEANDVVLDGDTGAYVQLAEQFSLERTFGDARSPTRDMPTIMQEHKIKHLPYVALAAATVRVLSVFRLEALPALQLLSALLTTCAVAVVLRLLARLGVGLGLRIAGGFMLAGAPGVAVYAGVPESWPLSLLLCALIAHHAVAHPERWAQRGLLVAVAMLNSPPIGAAVLFGLEMPAGASAFTKRFLQRNVVVLVLPAVVGIAAWLGTLAFLAQWDPSYRPREYLAFLSWFRTFEVNYDPASQQTIRHSLQHALLLPFVLTDGTVELHEYVLGSLWDTSRVAQLSMLAFGVLYGASALVVLNAFRSRTRTATLLQDSRWVQASLWLVLLWMTYHLGSAWSIFIYSSTLVLPIVLAICGVWRNHAAGWWVVLPPALLSVLCSARVVWDLRGHLG